MRYDDWWTISDALPCLPTAVEVAAFRIASEAMTNTARHSGASRCTVEIELDGTVDVTVADHGGSATSIGTGMGWTSMTERAAELGGSCTISNRAEGGLVLRDLVALASVVSSRVAARGCRPGRDRAGDPRCCGR
ncbi:MAG: hypothetical protein ABI776_10215 [Nocardioidaceae bacterium]